MLPTNPSLLNLTITIFLGVTLLFSSVIILLDALSARNCQIGYSPVYDDLCLTKQPSFEHSVDTLNVNMFILIMCHPISQILKFTYSSY